MRCFLLLASGKVDNVLVPGGLFALVQRLRRSRRSGERAPLLQSSDEQTGDTDVEKWGEHIDAPPVGRRRLVRNRFWLWLVLLRNPQLIQYRTHGVQRVSLFGRLGATLGRGALAVKDSAVRTLQQQLRKRRIAPTTDDNQHSATELGDGPLLSTDN